MHERVGMVPIVNGGTRVIAASHTSARLPHEPRIDTRRPFQFC